jgi:hypothetical protein
LKSKLHRSLIVLAWLALFTLNSGLSSARAQGTAFTYSGQLQDNGGPASGTYDLAFTLFTDSTGGVAVAGPVTNNAGGVTNGLFTVLVDFGPGVFTGQIDWLQIGVATNGLSSFTTLSPRQQLTPTPYALFASNAAVAVKSTTASNSTFSTSATTAAFFSGALSGDVTGTQSVTVVSSVGGQTAANVAAGVGAANAATSANTPGTIVQRDSSGSFSAGTITLGGNLSFPSTETHPAVIYSGTNLLLYADNNGNFFSGVRAGNLTMTGFENTAIGAQALFNNTEGIQNTTYGGAALSANNTGENNTANGWAALALNTTGNDNAAYGLSALALNTTGSSNTAIGLAAMLHNTAGSNNTALGLGALQNSTNDNELVAIGFQALMNDNAFDNTNTTDGNGHNTAVGYQALQANSAGNANTALGYQALLQNTSGIQNAAFGDKALYSNTAGSANVADGVDALYWNTSGSDNTAMGYQALFDSLGANNTAVGFNSLASLSYGSNNIALGYNAGANIIDFGSDNIDIGNDGASDDTGIIRIGVQGVQTECYLAGTVYADGVQLSCDRNVKENFTAVNARDVLARVAALPVTQWNYKKDSKDIQHIGPMAQDFQAAFHLSADDKHISVVDEGGVALAAIQGLNQKLNQKDAEIQTLQRQNDSLAGRLQELEATVRELAARK